MTPYRDMEPTIIEEELDSRWCEHCRFRHHPDFDFIAYDGTKCYLSDRVYVELQRQEVER